jgi:hypothetical protein
LQPGKYIFLPKNIIFLKPGKKYALKVSFERLLILKIWVDKDDRLGERYLLHYEKI